METTSQVPVKTRPTSVAVRVEQIGRYYAMYLNDRYQRTAHTREAALRFVTSKLEEIA